MGPLEGVKILEIAGIGPGPFAAMMLSDMGAEVLRIDRPGGGSMRFDTGRFDFLGRGRRTLALDLKSEQGTQMVLDLVEKADGLLEGFRPGVMERLGLGPDVCLARNPELVYGRMTGWGQEGPMSQAAGHDINYIALGGALAHIGRAGQPPTPPLNLVGDFGGGGLLLAYGIVCALLECKRSGKGQVVDAAMVDGTSALMAVFHGAQQAGGWSDAPGTNLLDSGAPFYDVYETKDGRYVSIGSIEPQFYAELIQKLGLEGETLPGQNDREGWPILRERFSQIFLGKTRDEWCEIMEGSDVCFAPVLTLAESRQHPHATARASFRDLDDALHPQPAPRFSRTQAEIQTPEQLSSAKAEEVLGEWGIDAARVQKLRDAGGVA
jgi:alpha-methylacyl-CoA racemase